MGESEGGGVRRWGSPKVGSLKVGESEGGGV